MGFGLTKFLIIFEFTFISEMWITVNTRIRSNICKVLSTMPLAPGGWSITASNYNCAA